MTTATSGVEAPAPAPLRPIEAVLQRMREVMARIPDDRSHLRFFAGTYLRTTRAVGDAVDQARFEDPEWLERWDGAFADLYLDAAMVTARGRTACCSR